MLNQQAHRNFRCKQSVINPTLAMHSPYMQDLYIRVLLCKRKLLYSVFSVFQYVKSSVIGLRRSVRLDKPFCFEPVLLSATLPTDKTSTVQQQNSKLHANFFRSSSPTYISRLYLRAPFQNEPRQLSTLMQSNS